MYKITFSTLIFLMSCLAGCVSQDPAPVEYKSGNNSSSNNESQKYNEQTTTELGDVNSITSRSLVIDNSDYGKPVGELHEPVHAKNLVPDQEQEVMPLPKQKLQDKPAIEQKKEEDLSLSVEKHHTQSDSIKFALPVQGRIITKFGEDTINGKSNGIDIAASKGSNVQSVAGGTVIYSGVDQKFGNLVIVKLDGHDLYAAYAHMQELLLNKGDKISQGDLIGHVGDTGNADLPKLHFAIRKGKISVDPLKYVE